MPTHGVRGVYSPDMVLPIAQAMREIGYKRAFVVHGQNADASRGMDEISTIGDTLVAELDGDGTISEFTISPEVMGIPTAEESAVLHVDDNRQEAIRMLKILSGEETGPRRDIVCLNAAPVLYITGHAPDLEEGMETAMDLIDSGKAIKKLRSWVAEQNLRPGESLERFDEMLNLAYAAS
jgi:anthranilate phosphoribosyltransferase